jgi:uncharacterized protein YpmS
MDAKHAVALKQASPAVRDGSVTLHVDSLSAGVLTLTKTF